MSAIIFCNFIFFTTMMVRSARRSRQVRVNDKTLVLYPMEQAATVLAHAAKFHKSASDRCGLLAAVGETSGDTFAAHPYREFGYRDATVTEHVAPALHS